MGRTFRVQGVPHEWDEDRLQLFLADKYGSSAPSVQSLARDVGGPCQTATVSFRHVPPPLQGGFDEAFLDRCSDKPNRWSSVELEDAFLGLTSLYTPPPQHHKVDIVAIHGLGGHAFGSFKQRGGEYMWLRDALPRRITQGVDDEPMARIMLYGYDSRLHQSDSFQNLEDLGTSLHTNLRRLAVADAFRPIVFVAHSLGGLVLKQTLLSLSRSKLGKDQDLVRAVRGIAFFGVPHDGMEIGSLIAMVGDQPNRLLVESINSSNPLGLTTQQRDFPEALGGEGDAEIVYFYETRKSPTARQNGSGDWEMTGPATVLVTKPSATHGRPWETGPEHICAINRTHSEMVKFGPHDQEYEKVVERIQGLVRHALSSARSQDPPKLSQNERDCLQSLSFPQIYDRANGIDSATEGTGTWVFESREFQDWCSSGRRLLWIKGKPGSGKSTLLKFIYKEIKATLPKRDLVLSFFFHARGNDLQRSPLGFFRSLLHQVLGEVPSALPSLVNEFQRRCQANGRPNKEWRWQEEELWEFFQSSIPKLLETRPVWLFVDALDESGKDNAEKLIRRFGSLLSSAQPHAGPVHAFRLCFSCRPYPVQNWDGGLEIRPEDHNGQDIRTFVESRLVSSPVQRSKIPHLVKQITRRASGLFLWARLVVEKAIDRDRDRPTLREVTNIIYATPDGLDDLYGELVGGMGPASLRLLQWIYLAKQPLTLDELRWATAIPFDCPHRSLRECEDAGDVPDSEQMKIRVHSLSRGLAEISVSDKPVVQFIHQSVKDFFMRKGSSFLFPIARSLKLAVGMVHLQLSRICLRYLLMKEVKEALNSIALPDSTEISNGVRESLYSRFGLLHYAYHHWETHASESDKRGVPGDELLKLLSWLADTRGYAKSWAYLSQKQYQFQETEEETSQVRWSVMHIAAKNGIYGALEAMLRNNSPLARDLNARNMKGRTPLSLAAVEGHEEILRLLLDAGQVDVNACDDDGDTPLVKVALRGSNTVKLLLDAGADIHSRDVLGNTPLILAASGWKENVVKQLLEAGANPHSRNAKGTTALIMAARNGIENIVKLLLDAGASLHSRDMWGNTALLYFVFYSATRSRRQDPSSR
ncbi:hypothetical protein VTK73DRAFT_9546 [Phialemonium thermophilum]|uniref:NACHT domain-containing protein n=1 Tax=Phialemonium thermophilum TaxID=223376 RepID=A0ABR3W1U9_9PEZI